MANFFSREFTFDRTARAFFLIILVVALIIFFNYMKPVLIPFLLAGIFAYVFMPIVKFVQHKLKVRSRVVSVLLVLLFILGVTTLTVFTLTPTIQAEIDKTWQMLQEYTNAETLTEMIPPKMRAYIEKNANLDSIIASMNSEKLFESGKQVMAQIEKLISSTLSVFSWTVVFFMGITYFIFIMMDFEKLAHGFINLFPIDARSMVKSIMYEIDGYMNSYFRGQALIAISVGILLSIGYKIIGLPMAIVIGLFIGMLNFIPYLQLLGFIPLTFLAILQSAQTGQNVFLCILLAYGVLGIVQIIQDTVLTPHIMGRQMGMRPSLILFSIAFWGYILGFFGLLIALPMTMSLYAIYKRYVLIDVAYIEEQEAERLYDLEKKKKKRKKEKI